MTLKSAADKLYDLITASPEMGSEKLRKFWNLENRMYAVTRFLELIGTIKDTNPTYDTDLETLANCVQKLEEKSKTRHWQKVYCNENRRLKQHHVDETIASLKSYIGSEARKTGKTYNKHTNMILKYDRTPEENIATPNLPQIFPNEPQKPVFFSSNTY